METAPDAILDDLVRLAARLCGTPVGLITLVDEARQLFKAKVGYDGPATAPLEAGFCPLVVESGEPLVIPDTLADPVHVANPATREGGVRFYAGVPLVTPGRDVLGTLCVLDRVPRPGGLDAGQMEVLSTLSAQVVSQFELRRSLAQRDALLVEQRASIRERDALARVQAAIVAAGGELDAILAALVAGALEALPAAEGGVLELVEGETLEYRAVGGTLEPFRGLRRPLHGSLSGHCAANNEAALVADARLDGRVAQDLAARMGVRAVLLAPVTRGAEVLGVLRVQSARVGAFVPRDLEVLRLFAGTATAGLTEVRAVEAQRAVLEAARRRQAIFDSAVDFAIIATDRDGRVTDWNAGAERILGWTAAEMHGGTVERIFTPEDRAADRTGTEMRLALERGRANDERWHLKADGTRFWASGEMTPLRGDGDVHAGFLKVLRDQTAQYEADAMLRDREARLRLATTSARLGTFDYRVPADELTWDDRCRELFGLPPGAPVSYEGTFLAGLHPEDRAQAHEAAMRSMNPAGSGHFSAEYRTIGLQDGIERWLLANGETLFENGAAVRLIGTVLDITDRKRAEAALRASEALLRDNIQCVQLTLVAGAIVGTWFWDLPTNGFTVDEAFAQAFGLDPILGRTSLSLEQVLATVHPDDKAGLAAVLEETISCGGACAHQYRVQRADGRHYWIEASRRVDFTADGTPLSFPGVLIDVDARRAVEAERDQALAALRALTETLEQRVADRTADLMRAEEQLHQSQKMEAVGQLTGGLAHAFNNLLTGVTGSLELMQARIAQGRIKDIARYVTAAQGAANRAAALTHRLLAFSRRQTLDPRPTDVNRLVHGMEDLIRRTVGPAITMEPMVETAGIWPTLVDPGQLENALLNLCINARDAMPDGGRLTIETGNKWMDARMAHERDLSPGQYVSLCVSDTGTGMSPDVVAKAFDRSSPPSRSARAPALAYR